MMLTLTPKKQQIKRNAKNIYLKVNKKGEIIITTPYQLTDKKMHSLINDNQQWLITQLDLYQQKKSALTLPTEIHLTAIDQSWKITYQKTDKATKLLATADNTLVIFGDYDTKTAITVLKKWLHEQAKCHLYPWLRAISEQTNLSYCGVTIRYQKSLWGSCSIDKNINLNAKLLFLPAYLVSHVLIHELCHTVHFDHTDNFWNLVATHDPLWRSHKGALKQGDDYMPSWLA